MKHFINDNFLLETKTSRRLYHEFSAHLPVIDFHCHLSPRMIAEDRQFENIWEAWLEGDHYKWRAMRTNGVSERYCTGDAAPEEKFSKWAETVPYTIGNPLYHWTHLELARYFGICDLLSSSTASRIYEESSCMLRQKDFSTRSLIRKMNVEAVCTTDDPADSLEYHRELKDSYDVRVLPTFRPDNIIKTDDPAKFAAYVLKLGESSGIRIKDLDSLISALDTRHRHFHENGCRISDHGLDRFYYSAFTGAEINRSLQKLLSGGSLTPEEGEKYKTAVMLEICKMNHARGWTQQFHVGALRNNNSRMFMTMGPDTGWDSIGGGQDPVRMSQFLDALDLSGQLAKTILYNLNPSDNEMMITMAGNFNDGSMAAKVQYGAAWWFLDQMEGMKKHLTDLSSLGLLRRFAGMVTDSRSFLSYPRHEYFRRIACNLIGCWIEKGLVPDEDDLIKPLVEDISYRNAKQFLGI